MIFENLTPEYEAFVKSTLLRAARSKKVISVKLSNDFDRKWMRDRWYAIINELNLQDELCLLLPDKPGEFWISPKILEEEINGKSKRRAARKNNDKPVQE